jgi:hypothetical protein
MSYTKETLMERLRTGESIVTFTKLNGDQRIMTCTTDPKLIPEEAMPKGTKEKKEPSAKQLENIGVYDINAKGWRSFKVANVTDVQTTEEAHEELIEVIKKPVRHYRIRLHGYGGESVYAKLTKEQFEFWNNWDKNKKDNAFNPNLNTLEDYANDPEEFRKHNDMPQEADFMWDPEHECHMAWHEKDDIEHSNGVDTNGVHIEIDEVDSDKSWGTEWIETLVENESLDKLLERNGKEIKVDYMDLDAHADENGNNYVFFFMSIEKGTFHDVYVKTEGKQLDVSKIDISATEMPNGDTIITTISYNGVELDNEFGDTTGKGYVGSVWNY